MKKVAVALGVVVALLALAAGAVVRSIYSVSTTVVAPEPDRPLLDWRAPLPEARSGMLDWETWARRDQVSELDVDTFLDPPIEYRPWTRWWWPGNVVDRAELLRQLRAIAGHGFGGVEIQPLGARVSKEDRAGPQWTETGWDTPAFYENIAAVLDEARSLGLRVDLTAGSGWPGGGPHVGLEDGMHSMVHGEAQVDGPTRASMDVPTPRLPAVHWAMGWIKLLFPFGSVFAAEYAEPLTVWAARVESGTRSWNPFDLSDQLVLDPETLTPLDPFVNADGRIEWDVPEGTWAVIALYRMPGGEYGGSATENPTYVLDHFDEDRVRAHYDYLFGARTDLSPFFGSPLRGFFNDSFEFKQERLWPRGVLDEFTRRRGYDPRRWLPALLRDGHDQAPLHWAGVRARAEYDLGESSRRFVEDWEDVVSDLFVERFVETSTDWAERHGLSSRVQAYGSDFDLLRAAGSASIPETEQMGGSMTFLKIASSGAHLYDRPLVTAESFVAKRRGYMSTPAKVKAQADQLIGAGVNQLLYHGTAYQVPNPEERGYGPDGWYPFSGSMFSDDFSSKHPHWESLPEVNRYIARLQYAMRLGRPESDVLVYYPFLGSPGPEAGEHEGPLFAGQFDSEPRVSNDTTLPVPLTSAEDDPKEAWLRHTVELLRTLEAAGVSWTWVNEHSLREANPSAGGIEIRGERFRGLLLSDVDALTPDGAEALARLAESGAPVAAFGRVPDRQRGLAGADEGDRRVRDAMARLTSQPSATVGPSSRDSVVAFLRTRLAHRPVSYDNAAVQTARRRLASGAMLVFVRNRRGEPTRVEMSFGDEGPNIQVLEPWSGRASSASSELRLDLPPYGSRLVLVGERLLDSAFVTATMEGEIPEEERPLDRWTLRVEGEDVVGGFFETEGTLFDWSSREELRSSASPGVYRTTFEWAPQGDPERRIVLDLGRVTGTAHVTVNGHDAGAVIVYPFSVDITSLVRPGRNEVEVTLVPPRRNKEIERRETEGGLEVSFLGAGERMPIGLLGPARLEVLVNP